MIAVSASKLSPWHRRVLEWTLTGLAVTGLFWVGLYYALAFAPDLDGPVARSVLHIDVMAHGIAAYAAILAVGSLLGRHIPAGLAQRRKLLTGIGALALFAVLMLSGLLLYYAGGEAMRGVASLAHQALGVAIVPLVVAHIVLRAKARVGGDSFDESI